MTDKKVDVVLEGDDGSVRETGNRPFGDVLQARLSRRKAMAGGLAAAATAFFGGPGVALARGRGGLDRLPPGQLKRAALIGFEPVSVADGTGPLPTISSDYQFQVLIPWGEPLDPGGPAYEEVPPGGFTDDDDWERLAENQAQQIGIGHDGMWYFPLDDGRRGRRRRRGDDDVERGMLCINHEFGTLPHVLRKGLPESPAEVRFHQHAHGVSVVAIERRNGTWRTVEDDNARRIHVNTPVAFGGPAAGSSYLETPAGNEPKGTVNNCANGETPWGTYLTCEENFNGYFGARNPTLWSATEEQRRYGFSPTGFNSSWYLFDDRFDLSNPDYVNEENRFGWVVEIDPLDKGAKPVKRTALGRFKHEGVAVTVGRGGRAVAYMGDDERFDYIYKFVSDGNWKSMRARGISPLDEGRLYVAKFHDDGSGEWLELTIDDPRLAARFADQAEVLTFARIAADLLGATPMDRPEWTTVAPDGDVYCTLTNNSRRGAPGNIGNRPPPGVPRPGADAANPLAPNADGHIIKIRDAKGHVGTTFEWDIFLIAEDTHGTEDTFSDPDGLWADPDGRLFIQTDGGQKDGLNNQMLVASTAKVGDLPEELRRLFTGPALCEITGIAVTSDRRTMFINVQHPGNGNPAATNFPQEVQDGVTLPRDATIVITRKDGGIVGS